MFKWFFFYIRCFFYEEVAELELAKVLWCVTLIYGWSCGCCGQDVSGNIWAVGEVTESKERVQFVEYGWREQNYFLAFYGLETPATVAKFYSRGFAVLGFSWVGKSGCFKSDAALLTVITQLTTQLLSLMSCSLSQCLLNSFFPLPGVLENAPRSALFHSTYNFEIIRDTCIFKRWDIAIADHGSGPLWDTGQERIVHWPEVG